MNATNKVKQFFMKMETMPYIPASDLKELMRNDVNLFRNSVTDAILSRRVKLEGAWSGYTLSDIDVYYDEDMLVFSDKLEMFGIRDKVPPIRSRDTGMIVVYRFTDFSAFGTELDSVVCFRVIIKQNNGKIDSRWIVMYS